MDMYRAKFIRRTTFLLIACMLLMLPTWDAHATSLDAEACDLRPLEVPLFGGTPVAEVTVPEIQATPAAEAYSDVAIHDVLEQYVACINTGDPTLVWALFTPRWFSETFADSQAHYLPSFEQMISLPGTEDEKTPLELLNIEEIVPLPDGRVDVTASFRSGDQEWQDTLTLAYIDGQWFIDEVQLDTSAP